MDVPIHDQEMNGDEGDDEESDSEYECSASELSDDSFFSDGSNVDSTDDEVCFEKEERQRKADKKACKGSKGKGKGKSNAGPNMNTENAEANDKSNGEGHDGEGNVEYSTDSEKYAGSDEERMASNSTDEDEA